MVGLGDKTLIKTELIFLFEQESSSFPAFIVEHEASIKAHTDETFQMQSSTQRINQTEYLYKGGGGGG